MSVRPLMYGYIRVGAGMETQDVRQLHEGLTAFATAEGFTLGAVYTENIRSAGASFAGLVEALKRAEVTNVIVPSLWHFARYPAMQEAMKAHVEQEVGAHVWVVTPPTTRRRYA